MRVSAVTVRKRLAVVLMIGLTLFIIINVRLGYVQFILGNKLTAEAKDLWSRNIPFEAKRGEIVDRNGVALATNKSAPTVYVVPRQIKNPVDTAKQLANILKMSKEKAYKHITKQTSIERIPEGRKISHETAKQIKNLNMAGVYIAEDTIRHYPFGNQLAHVLGFAGAYNQGLMGLELFYDEQLKGKEGSVKFYASAKGERMTDMADDYDPPIDGYDLMLTIDSKIQTIVERELQVAEALYSPEAMTAIVMNPNNGEILAMASKPDFNPAQFQSVTPEIYNRNLPVWGTYEPGSTFKIITLAAAIEEKKVDLEKDTFHDQGFVKIGGARLRCWKKGGHGSQSFLEVVENSCNPGFVELGERLGKKQLFSYIDKFGFGKKTGIDLQGEGTGIIFKPSQVGPVELATTSFGQGVSVTPIQQVAAVAAAVNGGYLYTPYIAKQLIDSRTGQTIMKKSPRMKRQVISKETSAQVRHALESVVAKGTGRNAFVDSYRVGGKTGTAQKAKDGRYLENNHVVSFIGFAPADDPQIVIYIGIDNPQGTVQFGGTVAAPIVGKVMEDSLRILNIQPRKNQIEKELTWLDPRFVEVPDLVGLNKNDLQKHLINVKFAISGDGTKIIKQSPSAGTKITEGGTVRIYLGE